MTLLRWLTFLLRYLTVTLTVLLFLTYLFLLTLLFVLQWLSLHSEILILWLSQFPLTFCQTQNEMPHFIALLMTILVFQDHLRDVAWEDIFKLGASAAASEEWFLDVVDVCIPHRKYQVKSHLSPWFSAACAAAIVHRNHFYCLY